MRLSLGLPLLGVANAVPVESQQLAVQVIGMTTETVMVLCVFLLLVGVYFGFKLNVWYTDFWRRHYARNAGVQGPTTYTYLRGSAVPRFQPLPNWD